MKQKHLKEDARLKAAIESTILGPRANDREAVRLAAREAADLGVIGLCVPPAAIATAQRIFAERKAETPPRIVTVVNFPFAGLTDSAAVRALTDIAFYSGAAEIDVVAPYGRSPQDVESFLRHMVRSANGRPIKAILETAALPQDMIADYAEAAVAAGVAWLKTSTGFHPAGGATVEAVAILRASAPQGVGVKASGGIRDRATALAMLEAGADRIGTSAAAAILQGE